MKPTNRTALAPVLGPALEPHGHTPDVLLPTPPSQARTPGSAWSFGIRAFGAGERFGGSIDHRAPSRASPRSVTPIALEGVAPEAEDVLVILGSAAHPERLRVERTDVSVRAAEPRLLVWLSLARSSVQSVPDGGGTARSDSVGRHLTGPAILLEIGVPPETHAEIASAPRAADRGLCGSGIVAKLLEAYVRTLAASSDVPVDAAAEMVARHTAELVRAALEPKRSRTERRHETVRERRVAAILAVIAANCRDPELCPDDVASCVGVSARYVHRLLQATGVTFGEHVIRARLLLADKALAEPSNRKIIDVAFDCGFKDVTHFSRRFRAFFGLAPREARASAVAAARVTAEDATIAAVANPAVGSRMEERRG